MLSPYGASPPLRKATLKASTWSAALGTLQCTAAAVAVAATASADAATDAGDTAAAEAAADAADATVAIGQPRPDNSSILRCVCWETSAEKACALGEERKRQSHALMRGRANGRS